MSEQIIDLRSTWAILRRRGGTLVAAAALGAVAGGALAYVLPPDYQSTSKVLLPATSQGSAVPSHTIDTQVEIASSGSVLGPAGRAVSPRLTADQVAERVEIIAPTTDVLSITATGSTPAQAQALSGAVANAEVAYLKATASALSEDARNALKARTTTLNNSLSAVNTEITKTKNRLSTESIDSPAGKADAAALAALTAQQADLVLQLDQVQKETTAGTQGGDGQPSATASVIQQASPATTMPPAVRIALFAAAGAGAAFFLVAMIVVLRGHRETALRSRDQLADAIGTPVVASIESRVPRSVAGWTSLLESYAPDNVEMWTLRQLLRLVTPGTPGSLVGAPEHEGEPATVVVITLSDDSKALAMGPQVASFAASTGLRTQLVAAQQHESANALWAACSGLPPDAEPRPGLTVDSRQNVHHGGDLVVFVAVMDREKPDLYLHGASRAVVLLAVTSGSATAEDLARVALAADDAGHPISRIVVVDPDPLDRTTGRLLPTERAQHVALPSLMTGAPVASEATALEPRRRFR